MSLIPILAARKIQQGANLNSTIPQSSEALFWLDGKIQNVGGVYSFIDRSGNGRNFLITGYDFSDYWGGGFAYKTAATISAPVDDAMLIAADLNNYLYTAGVPNQIPVVSLFQDIDYEHKLFTRHLDQLLDVNGVEWFEARIKDVAMYSIVRAGSNLIACQSYFNVPAEITTNVKWVAKNGFDTNPGTKSQPYLTVQKGHDGNVAGGTTYFKTGIYTSGINVTKSVNHVALGLCNLQIALTSQIIYFTSSNSTFTGCIFDGQNITGVLINGYNGNTKLNVFNKCSFIRAKTDLMTVSSTFQTTNYTNCNFVGFDNAISTLQGIKINSQFVKGCYFKHVVNWMYYTDGEFSNNKFADNDKGLSLYLFNIGIVIKGNTFKFQNSVIISNGAYTSSKEITIRDNSFVKTSNGNGITISGNAKLNILNNRFKCISETTGLFIQAQCAGQVIENNSFYSSTLQSFGHIDSKGIGTIIRGNYSHGNSLNNAQITLGGELATVGLNDNSIVENNHMVGYRYEHPDLAGGCHGLFIGNGINIKVTCNYLSFTYLGLVVKTGAQLAYTAGGIWSNKFEDCCRSIWVRGVSGLNVFNNTMFYSNKTYNQAPLSQINCDENTALAGTQNCENIIIKNNIIKSQIDTPAISFDQWAADHGCIAENNLFSGMSTLLISGSISYNDIATANAAGKLVGCTVTDPLLTVSLVPSVPIAGIDLGVNYNQGLDPSTIWGSDIALPTIVLKQQANVWQKGAFVQ